MKTGRILLLTTGGQDYLQDDLLYGFRYLFWGNAVDLPKKQIMYEDYKGQVHPRPEYAMNARYFLDDPVDRTLEITKRNFDCIINLSYRRIRSEADIYVDGEDDQCIEAVPNLRGGITGNPTVIFKRELPLNVQESSRLHPITFGLPDHLGPLMPNTGMFDSKTILVHSSFTVEHGPNRRKLAEAYPVQKHVTRREYVESINESKYVLSPKGAGWDCQRHYEILGRAVPIIEVGPDAPKHFQEMWVDGENCLTFDGEPGTIKQKVESVDSKQWNRMIVRGYEELYEKYLATIIASNLLKTAGVT